MTIASKKENIPDWVIWVAQDANGSVWGYEAEPHMHDSGWYENEVGRIIRLDMKKPNQHWCVSLQKL